MNLKKKIKKWWKKDSSKFIIELMLIFISVIFAFYVDRQYEKCKDNHTELGLLKEAKSNLEFNVKNIEHNIRQESATVLNVKSVLNALEKEEKQLDYLLVDYKCIAWVESLELENSGYSALKSFGLRKMKNDSLRKGINKFIRNRIS